jgi:8-oxo-dGTP pyrophosphatase MutT (NUDIX family)
MKPLPTVTSGSGKRIFSCFPGAVLVICVNDDEQLLLLSKKQAEWGVVAGAIEDNETVLDSALRESKEELGEGVRLRPLGTVHTHSFHYDENAHHMLSVFYLVHYLGGEIVPGDDMAGSEFRWWDLCDIEEYTNQIVVPEKQFWIFERAVQLFRLYKDTKVDLEYAVNSRS